jgi:hypothetical protein
MLQNRKYRLLLIYQNPKKNAVHTVMRCTCCLEGQVWRSKSRNITIKNDILHQAALEAAQIERRHISQVYLMQTLQAYTRPYIYRKLAHQTCVSPVDIDHKPPVESHPRLAPANRPKMQSSRWLVTQTHTLRGPGTRRQALIIVVGK